MNPRFPSPTPSLAASDYSAATEKKIVEAERTMLYEAYKDFKETGGRPSRKIDDDPGPCPPLTAKNQTHEGECSHCYKHWQSQYLALLPELQAWDAFRRFRQQSRAPDRFTQYKERVIQQMRQQHMSFELEEKLQTPLDQWKEFYAYWLRRISGARRRLAKAQDQLGKLAQSLPNDNEVKVWHDRDGQVYTEPALGYWRFDEQSWRCYVQDLEQLLPWIKGELPKIREERRRKTQASRPREGPNIASMRRSERLAKRCRKYAVDLECSNGEAARRSARLKGKPPLPVLPFRPTRIFKRKIRRFYTAQERGRGLTF